MCDTCAANRRPWRRRPDGVLISSTHETAVEVETTAKALDQYLGVAAGRSQVRLSGHLTVEHSHPLTARPAWP